jgi:hypothetical protein
MSKKLLGYDETLREVNGEFDYEGRSYQFEPIYEIGPGYIVTASFRLCRECNGVISSMGGPGYRSVCLKCYPVLKTRDFAEGHEHEMLQR